MADGAVTAIEKPKQSFMTLSTAGGIVPTNFEETWRIAETLAKSNLVRAALRGKPEDVMLMLMQGLELGLKPLAALTQIYVVDGVPSLSSKLKLALVRASQVCEYITCTHSDEKSATFKAKRTDQPHPVEITFTLQDAEAYGLLGKDNWKKKKVMLRWRAAGQICDLEFSDVIGAVQTYDEAQDMRERIVSGSHRILHAVGTAPPPPAENTPEVPDEDYVYDRERDDVPDDQRPAPTVQASPTQPSMSEADMLAVQIDDSQTREKLTSLNTPIKAVKNAQERELLQKRWTKRWNELDPKKAGK
jgi:hypothetical protein